MLPIVRSDTPKYSAAYLRRIYPFIGTSFISASIPTSQPWNKSAEYSQTACRPRKLTLHCVHKALRSVEPSAVCTCLAVLDYLGDTHV